MEKKLIQIPITELVFGDQTMYGEVDELEFRPESGETEIKFINGRFPGIGWVTWTMTEGIAVIR